MTTQLTSITTIKKSFNKLIDNTKFWAIFGCTSMVFGVLMSSVWVFRGTDYIDIQIFFGGGFLLIAFLMIYIVVLIFKEGK